MNNHSPIDRCPITDSTELVTYFDLGNIPLVNNLCDTREQSFTTDRFPLTLNYYPESKLTSLNFAVDGNLLFSHYVYKSSINVPYVEHCKEMYRYIQNYVDVTDDTKFVDVGGNDGTLLHTFKSVTDKNISVLNIDPSKNLAEVSLTKGVPVLTEFFNIDSMLNYKGQIDVITSTNVFQHLKDIDFFVKAVEIALSVNGIWVLEFPYWLNSMLTDQFDQIYHEHMYYHTVTPLKMLMEKNGLRIINVTEQDIHGGSLRLVMAKDTSKHISDESIVEFLSKESIYDINYHKEWGVHIQSTIQKSREYLLDLKRQGKVIYGFAAAAKGCIYLNAMELDHNTIDVVIDDTDLKLGKFIPGTGIEIVHRDILQTNPPDYILILAHNFKDYIIESLKDVYNGKYITLVPQIEIR